MKPVLLEGHSGACDEVLDSARNEHFAGRRQRRDARACVHRDSCHLPVDEFALPGVQPGAHLELELAHPLDDGAGTPDRPRGTVETGEEAIAGGVHFPAAEAHELTPHQRMMLLEQLTPGAIAERGSTLTRTDDVREEHSREDALRFGFLPSAV